MPRLLPPTAARLVLPLLAVAALSGCGDDEGDGEAQAVPDRGAVANVDLTEAQDLLERGPTALVREALSGDAHVLPEIDPRPADSARLASQSGREFDLLVFGTPAAARDAWKSVLKTEVMEEGGSAIRAVNLIAVFTDDGDDSGVARRVVGVLRELAIACGAPDGDAELRALCFERPDDAGAPGEGTDLDELAPIGAEVTVDGLRYRVVTARQLNPRIVPDRELTGGRTPGPGSLFFGVFVEVCNERSTARRSTGRLTLVDALGQELRPAGLPAGSAFAYRPQVVEPDDCVPPTDSAAERTVSGALVLFEIPEPRIDERPLGLRIVGRDGRESATVQVDV